MGQDGSSLSQFTVELSRNRIFSRNPAPPCTRPAVTQTPHHTPCTHPLQTKSVRPDVRGTTAFFMAEPTPHPKRPHRTPSRRSSFSAADGRAETEGYNVNRRGHQMGTVLTKFEVKGVHLPWVQYDQLLAPQMNYLLLGR